MHNNLQAVEVWKDGSIIIYLCFQESEPISNYLSSEIPKEVKQRIAKMGVDTLLKMVRCTVSRNDKCFIHLRTCVHLTITMSFSLHVTVHIPGFCG